MTTSPPRPIHFMHISKTGGTALRHALEGAPTSNGFELKFHPHPVTLRDIPTGEGVAFSLRDPVTRFASSFASRQRQGQPRYHRPHSDAEALAFSRFSSPDELAAALSSPHDIVRSQAKEAMESIQHVRHPFEFWLHDRDYLLTRSADLFFIGFQESLSSDFRELCRKVGLPASLQLPDDPVLAHRRPSDQLFELGDTAAENLRLWYRQDCELVELCKELRTERLGREPT